MIITCAIIDDEPLAANQLVSYVKKTPTLNLVGTYNSAISAIKDLREKPVDLLVLDIQMPELSGLEFAKLMPPDTKIIFTTGFDQYAVEGYNVNALDFLLKPIAYDRFLESVNKGMDYFSSVKMQKRAHADQFIFVKSDYKLVQISLNDILYVEGFKDYVKIFLDGNQKPVMSLINMKRIDEYLPHPEFMRIHRSYIVHMSKIKLVDRARIVFGDEYIPISESYKEEVQKYLDERTLN